MYKSVRAGCINYVTMFMPGRIVLKMDKLLAQRVGKFEVNWDMMFIEDPAMFLKYSP